MSIVASEEPLSDAVASTKKESSHIPALDGVRGIAIFLVLCVHFIPRQGTALDRIVAYLWCGVDLFFVLSGFLITGILLRTRTAPAYFRNFYTRRALRIFPLYYGVLLGLLILVPALTRFHYMPVDWYNQIWYWTYLNNIPWVFQQPAPKFGGHFWTLAIEEQFYAVWPLIVFLLSPRATLRLCLAIVLAVPLARLLAHEAGAGPLTLRMLTPMRLDSLAAGALIACAYFTKDRRFTNPRLLGVITALACVGVIACLVLSPSSENDEPSVQLVCYSLNALGFAAVVAFAARCQPTTAAGRFLMWSPLRFMGKYSYGIYVYHLFISSTVYHFLDKPRNVQPGWLEGGISAVVSVLVAFASYQIFESWFLRLKDRFAAPAVKKA